VDFKDIMLNRERAKDYKRETNFTSLFIPYEGNIAAVFTNVERTEMAQAAPLPLASSPQSAPSSANARCIPGPRSQVPRPTSHVPSPAVWLVARAASSQTPHHCGATRILRAPFSAALCRCRPRRLRTGLRGPIHCCHAAAAVGSSQQ